MWTSYTQKVRVLGDYSKYANGFVSVNTRENVLIVGGHFPVWFAKSGNDVIVTSIVLSSGRTSE